MLLSAGKEIREKFSGGGVEAFSRRNPTGSSPHNDLTKNRIFEEVPSRRDVVNNLSKKALPSIFLKSFIHINILLVSLSMILKV